MDKTLYDYQVITLDPSGLTSTAAVVEALPAEPPTIVGSTQVSLLQNQVNNQAGNQLTWAPANYPPTLPYFDVTKMYPLGGYYVYRSSDGGGTYQQVATIPSSQGVSQNSTYFDSVALVGGSANTYLIKAFDLPAGVSATDTSMVHQTPYDLITAYPLSTGAALDRNAIRPNGAWWEQHVDIRFVVTNPGRVEIKVYSLSGTYIKTLISNDNVPIGVWGSYHSANSSKDTDSTYPCKWDAHNMGGSLVASGVYLVTVEMNGHQEIDKVAVIK